MNNPFFSIIVPVYNAEDYLDECIGSVINQSFSSWELILINDGSTDSSLSICEDYADRYSNIYCINKENTGQFETRLLGIRSARGEYCIGLDSDDIYYDDCLEVVYQAVQKSDADVISWNLRLFGNVNRDIISSIDTVQIYDRDRFIEYIVSNADHSFSTKAIRRSCFEGEAFDRVPNVRVNDDYMMIILAVSNASRIYAIRDILYGYRQMGTSISSVYNHKIVEDLVNANQFVQDILRSRDILTDEIQRADYRMFLKAVSTRIYNAVSQGKFDADAYEDVHDMAYYVDSEKYESRSDMDSDRYMILRLFRQKKYLRLKLFVQYKVWKKRCFKKNQ